MARILHNDEWYEQIASEALYEDEFERLLSLAAPQIFPSHYLVPFKTTVYSDAGAAKPDFALIHRQYRGWWVVEAEMAHHSFKGHVEPQVATLARAVYGEDAADFLSRSDSRLDPARMRSVVKGQEPNVLVIVNAAVPNWTAGLRQYGAIVTVLEVFRSRQNSHLFRLNGEQPPEQTDRSSPCVVELARFLRILAPGVLEVEHGEELVVRFRGRATQWVRTDLQDRVYLLSPKPVSLNPRRRYELRLLEDGSLLLSEA